MTIITDDQLGQLALQQHRLFRQVEEGRVNVDEALNIIRLLTEGRLRLPEELVVPQFAGYVPLDQQVERYVDVFARQSVTDVTEADLRAALQDVSPRDGWYPILFSVFTDESGDVDLSRTLEFYWNALDLNKDRASWLQSDPEHLRLAPDYNLEAGVHLLWFNPNAYRGQSPEAALARAKADHVWLAGIEVLAAVFLFPEWARSWNGDDVPHPWLSGLQFNPDESATWSNVPFLRWSGDHNELWFHADWSNEASLRFGSPAVREY